MPGDFKVTCDICVCCQVETMLTALLTCLPLVQSSPTYDGTLQAVQTLASHHLLSTMTVLLNYPLPFSQ